jgi:hypothetical protein
MPNQNPIEDITSQLATVMGGTGRSSHATMLDGQCFGTGEDGEKGWICVGKTGQYWRADNPEGGPGRVSGVADKDGAFIPVPR